MQIAKGAEAVITKENDVAVKERIKKGYRLPELDERLRKRRTALEAKLLGEARRADVKTPQVLEENRFSLEMEFISGKKVKDILSRDNCARICESIGENIAKLHSYDIIHGDLTTSNMIFRIEQGMLAIYFIDFGLGFISKREEDKAVDLYLLHEVLKSTHFDILDAAWAAVLEAYKKHYTAADKVIKAVLNVERRGRYVSRGKENEKL